MSDESIDISQDVEAFYQLLGDNKLIHYLLSPEFLNQPEKEIETVIKNISTIIDTLQNIHVETVDNIKILTNEQIEWIEESLEIADMPLEMFFKNNENLIEFYNQMKLTRNISTKNKSDGVDSKSDLEVASKEIIGKKRTVFEDTSSIPECDKKLKEDALKSFQQQMMKRVR